MARFFPLLITFILFFLNFAVNPVHAHALQPAYLNLQEINAGEFDVSWKVPYVGESAGIPLDETPEFPKSCQEITTKRTYYPSGGILSRWIVDCGEKGLYGEKIKIKGLETSLNDVLLRLNLLNGQTYSEVLRASQTSYGVPEKGTRPQIAWSYLRLGVEHILTGYDHLLFVLGLVLLVKQGWLLFKTITAFTLAHSITLGCATLGLVNVPQAPVEAVIALSILFLAKELTDRRLNKEMGITERYPWLVALIFGLLHGFGFAGALTETGLPSSDIPIALLLFNIGVEIGQLSFVFIVLAIRFFLCKLPSPKWINWITPYAIGSMSAFWVIERITFFANL